MARTKVEGSSDQPREIFMFEGMKINRCDICKNPKRHKTWCAEEWETRKLALDERARLNLIDQRGVTSRHAAAEPSSSSSIPRQVTTSRTVRPCPFCPCKTRKHLHRDARSCLFYTYYKKRLADDLTTGINPIRRRPGENNFDACAREFTLLEATQPTTPSTQNQEEQPPSRPSTYVDGPTKRPWTIANPVGPDPTATTTPIDAVHNTPSSTPTKPAAGPPGTSTAADSILLPPPPRVSTSVPSPSRSIDKPTATTTASSPAKGPAPTRLATLNHHPSTGPSAAHKSITSLKHSPGRLTTSTKQLTTLDHPNPHMASFLSWQAKRQRPAGSFTSIANPEPPAMAAPTWVANPKPPATPATSAPSSVANSQPPATLSKTAPSSVANPKPPATPATATSASNTTSMPPPPPSQRHQGTTYQTSNPATNPTMPFQLQPGMPPYMWYIPAMPLPPAVADGASTTTSTTSTSCAVTSHPSDSIVVVGPNPSSDPTTKKRKHPESNLQQGSTHKAVQVDLAQVEAAEKEQLQQRLDVLRLLLAAITRDQDQAKATDDALIRLQLERLESDRVMQRERIAFDKEQAEKAQRRFDANQAMIQQLLAQLEQPPATSTSTSTSTSSSTSTPTTTRRV